MLCSHLDMEDNAESLRSGAGGVGTSPSVFETLHTFNAAVRCSESLHHPDQVGVGKTKPPGGFSLGSQAQAFVESSGVTVLGGDV